MINEKAQHYKILPQQMYGLYGLEQLLLKISQSPYQDSFVVKGGYLLSSIYGLETRATFDLDITIRRMSLTIEKVHQLVDYIVKPENDGVIMFELRKITPIRESFTYDGYNLKFYFFSGKGKFPIEIDLTTGEHLLPLVEKQNIPLIFENGFIEMTTYSVEQILGDKLYTTLAYGEINDKNSRMKDLYDIYFLTKLNQQIDWEKIDKAIQYTKKQRGITLKKSTYLDIIDNLEKSKFQRSQWEKYRQEMIYAKDVTFIEMINAVKNLTEKIISES